MLEYSFFNYPRFSSTSDFHQAIILFAFAFRTESCPKNFLFSSGAVPVNYEIYVGQHEVLCGLFEFVYGRIALFDVCALQHLARQPQQQQLPLWLPLSLNEFAYSWAPAPLLVYGITVCFDWFVCVCVFSACIRVLLLAAVGRGVSTKLSGNYIIAMNVDIYQLFKVRFV